MLTISNTYNHAPRKGLAKSPSSVNVMHASPASVAVCGGGIIGSSIAYYLSSNKNVNVTLIERCNEICTASAKAGGFLALDWCDGQSVGPLARKSFALHAELAQRLDADIGYRPMTTLSAGVREHRAAGKASPTKRQRTSTFAGVPSWFDAPATKAVSTIGTSANTAQVHPKRLTEALQAAAVQQGAALHRGTICGLHLVQEEQAGNGLPPSANSAHPCRLRVTGVTLEGGTTVEAEAVVLALGPWTHLAGDWIQKALPAGIPHPFPEIAAIQGSKAHSIVLQAKDADSITAHALFLQYVTSDGQKLEPEVYPRLRGEVYICGVMEEPEKPPARPEDVKPSDGACAALWRVAEEVSGQLLGAQRTAEQACLLPVTADSSPYIGAVPGIRGLYIAAGHSCWGILNGPATGLAMSELLMTGRSSSVDIQALDPSRALKRRRKAVVA